MHNFLGCWVACRRPRISGTRLVVAGFDNEHQDFYKGVGDRNVASASSTSEPVHRHRQYLQEGGAEHVKGSQSYRPKEMHRVASKQFLTYVDTQVREMTDLPGLSVTQPDWTSTEWSSEEWRDWHYILFASDNGPDQHGAYNSMENKWYLNVDQVGDVAHGLMRVADLVNSGHRVVFDAEEFGGG